MDTPETNSPPVPKVPEHLRPRIREKRDELATIVNASMQTFMELDYTKAKAQPVGNEIIAIQSHNERDPQLPELRAEHRRLHARMDHLTNDAVTFHAPLGAALGGLRALIGEVCQPLLEEHRARLAESFLAVSKDKASALKLVDQSDLVQGYRNFINTNWGAYQGAYFNDAVAGLQALEDILAGRDPYRMETTLRPPAQEGQEAMAGAPEPAREGQEAVATASHRQT